MKKNLLKEEIKYIERALEIENILNRENEDVINAYFKLGIYYLENEEETKGVTYLENVLEIGRRIMGSHNNIVINCLIELGIYYLDFADKKERGEEYLKNAIEIKICLGEEEDNIELYDILGEFNLEEGK